MTSRCLSAPGRCKLTSSSPHLYCSFYVLHLHCQGILCTRFSLYNSNALHAYDGYWENVRNYNGIFKCSFFVRCIDLKTTWFNFKRNKVSDESNMIHIQALIQIARWQIDGYIRITYGQVYFCDRINSAGGLWIGLLIHKRAIQLKLPRWHYIKRMKRFRLLQWQPAYRWIIHELLYDVISYEMSNFMSHSMLNVHQND